MKKIIVTIEQLPKAFSIGIILLYSLLLAEYSSTITQLLPYEESFGSVVKIFMKVSYSIYFLSGIIQWILMGFLFHLTALLFNGNSSFKRFLIISSYLYLILAVIILIGILILDTVSVPSHNLEESISFLMNNTTFKFAINFVNYSFFPYYLIVALFMRYIYQIKFIYALLSIAIPVGAIWLISELFQLV